MEGKIMSQLQADCKQMESYAAAIKNELTKACNLVERAYVTSHKLEDFAETSGRFLASEVSAELSALAASISEHADSIARRF